MSSLLEARIVGNKRFQDLLRSPEEIEKHLSSTQALVRRMAVAVESQPFIAGSAYSIADAFATAALARFTLHKFGDWWRGTDLEDYYARMKARPSFNAAGVIDTGTERDV